MSVYSVIFSPTGGTKKVADLFASAFADEYKEVDMTDACFEGYSFEKNDICIVSVPSFGGRVPVKAAERIAKLSGNGAKAVLVAVYGNREFEDTLVEMQDIMENAGFVPVAALAALAEHSIIRTFAAGRPDENDAKVLADCAMLVKEKLQNTCGCEEKLEVPGNRPYKQLPPKFPSKPQLTDACVKCGLCVKKCPVQAIPEDLSISMDEETCISCMRCEAICPVGARKVAQPVIDFLTEKLTIGAKGYKDNQLFL